MRKAVVATSVVAASMAALLVGSSLWSGRVVRTRLAQQTAQLVALSPGFKVVEEQTHVGLFSSTRELTLQLGCVPAAAPSSATSAGEPAQLRPMPLLVRVRDVIRHGPLPGASSLGVATIDSELYAPAVWKAQLERVIGRQPPVRVHSKISYAGDLVSDLTFASVRWSEATQGSVRSEPLHARLMGNVAGSSDDSWVLDVPGAALTMSGPDGATLQVKLGRVLVETVLGKRPDEKLWLRPAHTTGFVSAVELDGKVGAGKSETHSHASWDGIKLHADSKLEGGMLHSDVGFTTKGKVNGFAIDKVALAASLERVDAAALQRVLAALFGTTLRCESSAPTTPDGLLSALQQELAALIVHNPTYSLDTFEVELGGQRAELSYRIGTEGVDAADLSTPILGLLMQKGFARGKLQASVGMVELVANKLVNYDSKPSQETPMARTSAIVGSFTDKFVREGYVQRQGDQLRVALAFEHGQLQINGKSLGLPTLSLPASP